MIVAPSCRSCSAASALGKTLFIARAPGRRARNLAQRPRRARLTWRARVPYCGPAPMPATPRTERLLDLCLAVGVLDCAYLSWRYLALHAGLVVPGTGLCSWSAGIDCDKVLGTPQARAFFVPNALLGLGFFAGALAWRCVGAWLLPEHRRLVLATLAFWLCVATVFTARFWWLL